MPATAKNKLRTPLRRLRVILGDYGQPLTQGEFAAQTPGLSVDTVQAIEHGRRNLTKSIEGFIRARWLATWDAESEEWLFLGTKKLYSRELGARVRPLLAPAQNKKLIREKLHARLDDILDTAGDEAFHGEAMLLNEHLRDHVEQTGRDSDVDLDSTEPAWSLHHAPETKPTWPIASYSGRKKRTQTVPKQKTAPKTAIKRNRLNDATA